jgi:hypothetical protein
MQFFHTLLLSVISKYFPQPYILKYPLGSSFRRRSQVDKHIKQQVTF